VLVVLVWWLAGAYGVEGVAAAWLPAVLLSQILCITFVRQILPSPFSGLGLRFLAILGATAIGGALAWLVDARVEGLAGFLLAAAVGALASLLVVWLLNRMVDLDLADAAGELFPALGRVLRAPPTSR
jgi:low temperature requirement protein LtrA